MPSKFDQFLITPEEKSPSVGGKFSDFLIPIGETENFNQKKEQTAVGGVIRSLAETPTQILQNLRALGQTLEGRPEAEIMRGRYSPYLGKQIIPQRATDQGSFGKAVGQGLELASYLPVTSGLGAASKTTLAGKIGQGALTLGKEGTFGGALYEGGRAIQEGEGVGDVLMRSLVGGVAGGIGGAVLGGVGAVPANIARNLSKTGQIEKYNNALTEFFTGTKRGLQITKEQQARGKDIAGFLSKYRDNFGVPEIKNGKFDPTVMIDNIYNTASRIESETFSPLLKSTGENVDLLDVLNQVKKAIASDYQITRGGITQKAVSRATSLFDDYINSFGRDVPLDLLNEIKRVNWSKRFTGVVNEAETIEGETAKIIGQTIKKTIEDVTAKYFPNRATNPIKEINGILGDHYSAAKTLKAFEGNVVGNGRFGKWMLRLLGGVAGSKGGPIGSIIGSITADQLANLLQTMSIDNPLRKAILRTYTSEAPQVLKEAQNLIVKNINKRALPSPTGKPTGRLGQMDLQRAQRETIPAFPKSGNQIDYIGERKVIIPKERVSPQVKKVIKDKEGFIQKIIDSGLPPQKAMAVVAGIEQDENGDISFNPEKAGAALALVFGGSKFLETNAGKKLMKEVEDYVVDFIDNPKLGLSIEDVSKTGRYMGEKDLTTKILKDLEGKTTVSKQYILDATNRGELKQVERDLIRDILERETGGISKDPLIKEARKYKSAEEFVKAQGTPTFSGGSEITKEWSNERMSGFGTIYRGRNELGGGIYVTDSPEYAKTFGTQLSESSLKNNLKLLDIRESSKAIGSSELSRIKKGFDSYKYYLKNGGKELLPTDYPDEILNKIQEVYGGNSTDILKNAGFDGIVADESRIGGQGGTVWNIFDAKNIKTKSQLTNIWNKANKNTNLNGGFSRQDTLLAGAGLTALGATQIHGKSEKYQSDTPIKYDSGFNEEDFRKRIVGVENEGIIKSGEGNVYESVGSTGDLGKYQASPDTLKAWADDWLGKDYTKEEFLDDPEAQELFFDTFITNVVKRYKVTPQEAAVLWHRGWGVLGNNEPFEVKKKKLRDYLKEKETDPKALAYVEKFNNQ